MDTTIKPSTNLQAPKPAASEGLQQVALQARAINGDRTALAQLDRQAAEGSLGWGQKVALAIGKLMAWGDERPSDVLKNLR